MAGRFITIDAGTRQGEYNASPAREVPAELVGSLRNLCAVCLAAQKPIDVELDAEADAASTELRNAVQSKINLADHEITRHLYGRVHLNVLKLAAILAVGRTPIGQMPTISKQDMMWASRVVCAGVDLTANKVDNDDIGEVGGNQTKQLKHVERVLTEYTWGKFEDALKYLSVRPDVPDIARKMFDANVVTEAYIQRRLFGVAAFKLDKAGPTFAIKRAIKSLLEADDLRELSRQQTVETFGVGSKSYTVSNPHRFKNTLKHLRGV